MRNLLYSAIFAVGLILIVFGHQSIGPLGFAMMLVGLGFLISLLWLYNRSYK